jgi:hypothetical protein
MGEDFQMAVSKLQFRTPFSVPVAARACPPSQQQPPPPPRALPTSKALDAFRAVERADRRRLNRSTSRNAPVVYPGYVGLGREGFPRFLLPTYTSIH